MVNSSIPRNSRPRSGAVPMGNINTAGGGGFNFDANTVLNIGRGLTNKILSGEKHKGLQSKNPDLYNAIKANQGQGLDPSLFVNNSGLFNKGTSIKKYPNMNPQSEQGSLDAYNSLRDTEIQRLKSQQELNKLLQGMLPSLLGANSNAVGKYSSMLDQGLTELDPAIANRIDRGVQGYIGNASNNLKDLYTGIADSFVNDVAQGGIGGFGVGEGFKNQVTEPLSRELGNIANNAEVYRGQLTNDVLSNQRQGLSTIAGTTPALNQILQGFQMPTTQVNPAAINPTGNFDPGLLAQLLMFGNNFSKDRDTQRMQPYLLELQAQLQKEIADSQQGSPWGQLLATLVGAGIGTAVGGPAGGLVGGAAGSQAGKAF